MAVNSAARDALSISRKSLNDSHKDEYVASLDAIQKQFNKVLDACKDISDEIVVSDDFSPQGLSGEEPTTVIKKRELLEVRRRSHLYIWRGHDRKCPPFA